MDAVIFDFDGTLVDTLPLHYEAYRRVLADVGLTLSQQQFRATIGGSARDTIPLMLAGRPCSIGVEEIHRRKKAIIRELFASEPVPVLATAELLAVLYGRLPMAIASSGSRPGIEQLLARLGWTRCFQVVVTGEDVVHGKPAPDLFLAAADALAVPPAACMVFEDTDAGVAAARAAGMRVFDVRATSARWSEGPRR